MKTESRVYTADGINIVAGIWLVIAPFLFGYNASAIGTNNLIIGLAIAIIALIRVFSPLSTPRLDWANMVLAAWLIVSGFVLPGMTAGTAWNNVILGVAVIALSYWGSHAVSKGKHI